MYYLFAIFRQNKKYWVWRSRLVRYAYFFYKIGFKVRKGANESVEGYVEVRSLFSSVQLSVFVAIAFALGLWLLDRWMTNFYELANIHVPVVSDYVSLLSGIAGVAGVFIGLYYAAIGGVVSAVYSKAPPSIRTAFSERMYGGAYMRYLSFLTVMCLCLIALTLLTNTVSVLSIPVVVVCAAFGVFSFVRLGQQVFHLFDQAYISRRVFEQLANVGNAVGCGGPNWSLSGFQDYYRKQAASHIDVLMTLVGLIKSDSPNHISAYLSLCTQSCDYLAVYSYQKTRIPVDSKWYPGKFVARSWADADNFAASIASRSGTPLMPTTKPDFEWLENAIFQVILACLKSVVASKDVAAVNRILQSISALAERLSVAGELRLALSFLEDVAKAVFQDLNEVEPRSVNGKLDVVAADIISQMPSMIFLGYIRFLKNNDLLDSGSRLSEALWRSKRKIYSSRFPFCYLETAHWLSIRLDFELRVRGKMVSPSWYQLEMLKLSEANFLSVALDILTSRITKLFEFVMKQTESKALPFSYATSLSREWEYWIKFESAGSALFDRYETILSNAKLTGLQWPSTGLTKEAAAFIVKRKACLTRLQIESALDLESRFLKSAVVEYADYSGQFLLLAADQLASSFIDNDPDLSRSCFKSYILASSCYFTRNLSSDDLSGFFKAARFLKEAMEVSAFGKLLSEFHANKSLVSGIESAWVSLASDKNFNSGVLVRLAAYNQLWDRGPFDGSVSFPYRDATRQFEAIVQELPRKAVDRFYSEVEHESNLIRLYSDRQGDIELIDLFMTTVALPLGFIKVDQLTFGQKDLLDAMDRR